jgi:fatty-acyl-CoA synthase
MRNEGVGSWPDRRRRMSPNRVAITFEGEQCTYHDLAQRVDRLANALRALGLQRSERIAYLGLNHPASLETIFAAGLLGAITVPINSRLAIAEVQHILDQCQASMLIIGSEHRALARQLMPLCPTVKVWIDVEAGQDGDGFLAYGPLLTDSSSEHIDEPVELTDPCLIMYTSGTTGRPKGAVITHANMTWNNVNQMISVDLRQDERTLAVAPLFHMGGLNLTVMPTLMLGGTVRILRAFDASATLRTIAQDAITSWFAVPTMLAAIMRDPEFANARLDSLRTIICGGAPLDGPTLQTWLERGVTVQQGYGMTEAAPSGLMLDSADALARAGSAGRMSFFTDVRVVDAEGKQVGAGEIGEIVLQGPNLMPGYWRNPIDTAHALRDGWFRSGDAGIVDADGFVYVRDRFKDMYISGGENVYPAEVENALITLKGIRECAVVGVPDDKWGEVGIALIVAEPGEHPEPQDLLDQLAGRLGRYKIPREIRMVPALPRTATGKIAKSELRAQLQTERGRQ